MIDLIKRLIYKAWQHKGLRHYGANTVWLFAEKAVRMVIGFVVGIYVARQLGPAKYGLLNYAISLVGIFAVISSLGLDSIVVRELVKTPEKRDDLLGTTFLLKSVGVFLMLVILGCTLFFTGGNNSTKLIIIIIAGGYLFQVFQTIDFYFQAKVLSKYVAISQMASWILVSCGRAWGAWKGYPVIYFAWLEAANMAITSLGYLLFYMLKVDNPFRWRFNSAIVRHLLKESWPLLLSGAAGIIYMRIDQVMIKSMLNDTQVGYYAAAAKFSEIWYFFPLVISSTLLPAVIRSRKVSYVHYMQRLKKYYFFMIWISIFICLGMNLISYHLITILLGRAYIPAVNVLIIYMWQLLVLGMTTPWGNWIIAENMQIYLIIYSATGAIVNIVLNYILITKIGITGAAIATVVAPFFSFLIVGGLNKKLRQQLFMALKAFLLVELFEILNHKDRKIY